MMRHIALITYEYVVTVKHLSGFFVYECGMSLMGELKKKGST
jgi:hypothetical protein